MTMNLKAFQDALIAGREALNAYDGGPDGRSASRTSRHVAPIHRYVAMELAARGLPASAMVPNPDREDGRYMPEGVDRIIHQLRRSRLLRSDEGQDWINHREEDALKSRRNILGAYHQKEVDVSVVVEGSGPLVVVSVKAPTSSVGKNAVNRYEEGIGEATNLHTRFPMLVFGFLMVLPKVPELYVDGEGPTSRFRTVEKLLGGTSTRRAITDPPGGYEAAALALVDYDLDVPALISDAPAPESPLRLERFFDTLVELHHQRNGAG